jgi:hypothetical protein
MKPRTGTRRHFLVATAGLMSLTSLSACSPTYDWREVRSEAGRYSVLFPKKPGLETRTLPLLGTQIELSWQSTQIEDTLFAVGHAAYPAALAATPGSRAQTLALFEQAWLRNFNASVQQAGTVSLGGRYFGAPPEFAKALRASGQVQGKPVQLRLHLLGFEQRLLVLMVFGSELPAEESDTFLTSLRPD